MTVSIVIFAVLLFGVNSFFIEKYYINSKKHSLIQVSKELNKVLEGKSIEDFNDDELIYTLDRLEKSTGTAISIGKMDGTIYYPQRPGFLEGESFKRNEHNPFFILQQEQEFGQEEKTEADTDTTNELNYKGVPPNKIRSWEIQADSSVFIMTKDPRFMIDTLRYQFQLDNGLMLSTWVPMAEITESASISNRFTSVVAILTILITAIWALFISGRFTRPIKQMNRITKEISELNFTQALHIQSEDEIGQLSQSINHLSSRLAKAIRELDNKNKQLENDIDRERKLDKMRREFVSSVTHELRTPIFLIQGYAEGLKNNIAQDKDKKDFYCDVIIDETSKMDLLVKDLVDLSQMESGMFSIRKVDFDIAHLVTEIIQKFEPSFAEKDISLEVQGFNCLMVNADPVRTEQVLVNLLNNALNHINAKKIIRINIEKEEDKAKISVYNKGLPIPVESLDKIWDSFYKVDKARARNIGGMGMGLSIVKAIQNAHHNEYGVQNVKGGVEFWININLAK
jgi:signal transduction histidine kinase